MRDLPTLQYMQQYLRMDENGHFFWVVDVGRNNKSRAGNRAGALDSNGYRQIKLQGGKYPEHRVVWLFVTGAWPEAKLEIDHKNRIRDDNHPKNLRVATKQQNSQNQIIRANNTTGFKGVCVNEGKYLAQINNPHTRKRENLGRFATAQEASTAYRAKELEYFGEFARRSEFIV